MRFCFGNAPGLEGDWHARREQADAECLPSKVSNFGQLGACQGGSQIINGAGSGGGSGARRGIEPRIGLDVLLLDEFAREAVPVLI